jgi:hypothetical protein
VTCTTAISGLQVPSVIDGDEVIPACRESGGTGHVVADEWVWQVVELRANGRREEIVWLDGSGSRDWTKDEGFDEGFRLSKKWATPFMAYEAVGQSISLYEEDARRAARRAGAAYLPIQLKATYKGKNVQFGSLCSRAERDEFLILDTIDEDFRAGTLDQVREWRPLDSGRNALRFDDRANALSFACDPALREYAPQPEITLDPIEEELEREYTMAPHKTRYMGI